MSSAAKRFRFDSFASEFGCREDQEDVPDNDSGIDSEETQISPPLSTNSSPDQPLSLVMKKEAPSKIRHWKKFLKDQAVESKDENKPEEPVVSVAQALLSLGQTQPAQKAFHALPLVPQPHYSAQPLRPIPLALRPLQDSQTTNRQTWSPMQQPENLSIVKLPQHPSPLVSKPFCPPPPPFLRLQSPTLSSTCQAASPPSSSPMPLLPQQPLNILQPNFIHPAFQSENNLVRAKKPATSNTDKPFSCLECKKSFSTQSGYAKHQQLHCNNQIPKSFSCKYCQKGYTSLSALKMHIRTHTLPCKCHICGKSFSRPWLLQGHVRTHTGEKPFSCDYCTRSFADKSNLRAHLQTHLQTKKYSCPGCKKTFSRMSLLNKHTDSGCQNLQNRNEECVQTLVGFSSQGLIRT